MASVAVDDGEAEVGAEWETEPHPWRRYFARCVDISIFGILSSIIAEILALVFWPQLARWMEAPPLWANLLIVTPISVIVTGIGAAFCQSRWKATAGKWLFRLRVEAADGTRMSFRQACRREARLAVWGFGLGLPLLVLIAVISGYNQLENDGVTDWDRRAETVAVARKISGGGYVWAGIGILLFVAGKLFGTFALMFR